ncbi:hypothetical protein PJWF_00021 [Achromobacter phage JWF]|uniref:hypothetical protein n=1 Tax=Achromobacter phage JWF TaxID=1589748 RepID=UPI000588E636|nr:hypothetical protein AXJ13_gp021 [Achromobacter phage JWF]AJD82915.1 hypothetical protein PJWF_00021 [Achromobacter phage JWF]
MAIVESTFNFPVHTVGEKYSESGTRVKLGNSYQFDSPPVGPDQRIFTLNFESMIRLLDETGQMDTTTMREVNAGALLVFYETHRLYKPFYYPHPWLGTIIVKFNTPLDLPKGIKNGGGWCEAFSVELIEQP